MFVACDESGVGKRFFVLGSVWKYDERVDVWDLEPKPRGV